MLEQTVFVVAHGHKPEAPDDIVRMILERDERVVAVDRAEMHTMCVRVEAASPPEARAIIESLVAQSNPRAYEMFDYYSGRR